MLRKPERFSETALPRHGQKVPGASRWSERDEVVLARTPDRIRVRRRFYVLPSLCVRNRANRKVSSARITPR